MVDLHNATYARKCIIQLVIVYAIPSQVKKMPSPWMLLGALVGYTFSWVGSNLSISYGELLVGGLLGLSVVVLLRSCSPSVNGQLHYHCLRYRGSLQQWTNRYRGSLQLQWTICFYIARKVTISVLCFYTFTYI